MTVEKSDEVSPQNLGSGDASREAGDGKAPDACLHNEAPIPTAGGNGANSSEPRESRALACSAGASSGHGVQDEFIKPANDDMSYRQVT
jgi:hypothetical protein